MKKLLLAAIILSALSFNANAGRYENAVLEQEVCESQGNLARAAYNVKTAGVTLDKFEAHIVNLPDFKKEISLIGYKSPSADSAYMRGWAKCKDQ